MDEPIRRTMAIVALPEQVAGILETGTGASNLDRPHRHSRLEPSE
jgi:hypothetical protein